MPPEGKVMRGCANVQLFWRAVIGIEASYLINFMGCNVEVVSPTLNRPVELLRERLPIGTPSECAEKLRKLQAAGVQRVFLWPVEDEVDQLARFQEQVLPQLSQ